MSARARFPVLVFVLVAGAGLAAFALTRGSAPPAPSTKRSFARRLELPGVGNVAEVASGLYRGAQPTREGFLALKKLGVRTVVSLRTLHKEAEDVKAAGLEPVELPLQADVRGSRPPTPEEVARFLSVVLDPARRPVYFHCAHGQDRTGTMCAVYRMEVEGWSPEDAFAEMQEFGFNDVWLDLAAFVKGYRPTRPR